MKRNLNKIFTAVIFCIASLSVSQKGFAQLNAAFTGPTTVCVGNTVGFVDQSTGGPIAWF